MANGENPENAQRMAQEDIMAGWEGERGINVSAPTILGKDGLPHEGNHSALWASVAVDAVSAAYLGHQSGGEIICQEMSNLFRLSGDAALGTGKLEERGWTARKFGTPDDLAAVMRIGSEKAGRWF